MIKEFIYKFKNCPFCGQYLEIKVLPKDIMGNTEAYDFSIKDDKALITLTTSNYVYPKKHISEFSISFDGDTILPSKNFNDFTSLYDVSLILSKKCTQCTGNAFDRCFSIQIRLFYDRHESKFGLELWLEDFGLSYEDNYYYYSNSPFGSSLSINRIVPIYNPFKIERMLSPRLCFDKLNFSSPEKLVNKLNSIRLLR